MTTITMKNLTGIDFSRLPKKAECDDALWESMKCVDAFWRSVVRAKVYRDQRTEHLAKAKALSDRIALLSGLDAEMLYADMLMQVGIKYVKKENTFSAAKCLTFKKTVLRYIGAEQGGTFTLTNDCKGDSEKETKSKKSKKAEPWVLADHTDSEIAARFCCDIDDVAALRKTVKQILAA